MNEKIPTAEEFLKTEGREIRNRLNQVSFLKADAQCLIEFTKLHVKQALKKASEVDLKAERIKRDGQYTSTMEDSHYTEYLVDVDSILNSYPDDLIK